MVVPPALTYTTRHPGFLELAGFLEDEDGGTDDETSEEPAEDDTDDEDGEEDEEELSQGFALALLLEGTLERKLADWLAWEDRELDPQRIWQARQPLASVNGWTRVQPGGGSQPMKGQLDAELCWLDAERDEREDDALGADERTLEAADLALLPPVPPSPPSPPESPPPHIWCRA